MQIVLLILLAMIPLNQSVEIVGLFPKCTYDSSYEQSSASSFKPYYCAAIDVWSRHCVSMFNAAIMLANQYDIRIHNENITGGIIRTNNDENGHASLNLLCQYITARRSNIVGIIGPASSTNVRFIGPFAAHINLPVISYAATVADFSDIQLYPTFYRTVPSDLLHARAIVQQFEQFKWKTCTMIFAKNDYGYSGIRILSEDYHNNITIKAQLSFDGDKFHDDLKQTLDKSQSRIVLVWADQEETTNIIKHAFKEGLIGQQYVWITTNKVALDAFQPDILNSSESARKFEGLLAVVPVQGSNDSRYHQQLSINQTLLNDALIAWQNSPNEQDRIEYPLGNESSISSFAMFTFDATWALIQALSKTSVNDESFSSPWFVSSSYCFNSSLEKAIEYHEHLKKTQFLGVSGPVALSNKDSNDRVGGAYYVLQNLQYRNKQLRYVQVMRWHDEATIENGNWQNVTGRQIIWPNGSKEIPKDYPQIQGIKLRIRVINSPPFVMSWNKSSMSEKPSNIKLFDTQDENIKIYGYVAEFIDELQRKMGFKPEIDAAPLNTTYNSIVESISENKKWDIAISDITITSNRIASVDFSLPIFEDTVRIAVRQSSSTDINFFSYLNPFSFLVWLSIIGIIFFSGLLVYIFEKKDKETFLVAIKEFFGAIRCIIRLGGNFKIKTIPSHIVSDTLPILGAILFAMYTANLAAFLALQRTNPVISGIDDIKNGRLPFHRIGVVKNSSIVDYYIQNVSDVYYSLENTQDIYLALLENRIDAALADATALEYTIDRNYCGHLSLVGAGFAKSSFGIAMKKNWEYKADFDINILSLRESSLIENLEKKWCLERICNNNVDYKWESDGIPLSAMAGLFITFLGVIAIAVVIHIWRFLMPIFRYFKSKIGSIRKPVYH